MKKTSIVIVAAGALSMGTAATSCLAVATSSVGIAIIKQVLLGGIAKGLSVFNNKEAFLKNNLIDEALPQELRKINQLLERVAPSLVAKERDYIAQAAAYTVNTSEPILKNAVNSLTAEDVTSIANGAPGTATQILKEKSQAQLVQAILPKVDQKLNEFGIISSINMALKGNNFLGSILGQDKSAALSASNGLSELASEQLVNGLFKIIENHEKQNSHEIKNALGR